MFEAAHHAAVARSWDGYVARRFGRQAAAAAGLLNYRGAGDDGDGGGEQAAESVDDLVVEEAAAGADAGHGSDAAGLLPLGDGDTGAGSRSRQTPSYTTTRQRDKPWPHSSRYRGVSRDSKSKCHPWSASVMIALPTEPAGGAARRKAVYLGGYSTETAAAAAYDYAAVCYYSAESLQLNYPRRRAHCEEVARSVRAQVRGSSDGADAGAASCGDPQQPRDGIAVTRVLSWPSPSPPHRFCSWARAPACRS
jgi:hypothetical protein